MTLVDQIEGSLANGRAVRGKDHHRSLVFEPHRFERAEVAETIDLSVEERVL